MEINSDFADLLRAFNAEGVRYLIVGAHAVASHWRARATSDFDVWGAHTKENASRVFRALAAFGAPLDNLRQSDLDVDDLIFQIGIAPVRIDVLTGIDGVEFEDALNHRLQSTLGDVPVNVISKEDLIANKRAAGRPKDLADVERLTRQ